MSALEQDSGRADIRSERSHGRRSERSRGNMPVPCHPKPHPGRMAYAPVYMPSCTKLHFPP
jgi:hypothetical protein